MYHSWKKFHNPSILLRPPPPPPLHYIGYTPFLKFCQPAPALSVALFL